MLFTTCNVATVSSISPLSVAYDTLLTVSGTGFSSTSCENEVYINKVLCATVSSTSTQITCKLGLNSGLVPGTLYPIEVLLKNVGYAIQNAVYQISFLPVISAISTNQGSIAGGTLVNITGDGFVSALTLLDLDVTRYSQSLQNAQITYNSISVTTALDQAGTFEMLVHVNAIQALCESSNCNFTFTADVTPTVNSIQPTTFTALNTQFTISGVNFGTDSSKVHVTIGSVNCAIVSVVDTSIVCTLAALDLGSQSIDVLVDGKNMTYKVEPY